MNQSRAPSITFFPIVFMVAGFLGCLTMALVPQCTKEQATQVLTTGAGAAQIVCAVVLEPNGTERKICDTGAKLAELLGVLLSEAPRSPAPSAAWESAPAPAPSAASSSLAPAASATPEPQQRPKLLLLYVPPADPLQADGGGGG